MTAPPSYTNFYFQLDCSPGLVMSDSEESSFSSCGTDEFFDFEDNISNALHLIDAWQKHHRRVRFGCTRVQEYAITVGDHPVCQDGLALSLDWSHSDEHVYDVDDFEQRRRRKSRRRGIRRRTSKLDYWQRREILNRVGSYTNSELSRIESERNREAVSEFLADGGLGEIGPSEEDGVGVEQVYINAKSSSCCGDGEDDWQMTIQVLEG
jgi:hypothetical protein